MAEFKIKADEKSWARFAKEKAEQTIGAAVDALRDTAVKTFDDALRRYKEIKEERKFKNPIWENLAEGLRLLFKGETGEERPRAIIFNRSRLAAKFEHGGTISGKPLLWIPTTSGAPTASQSGKRLVSVNVRGHPPMLFEAYDGNRDRRPLYIGVKKVRARKLTDIAEIIKKGFSRVADSFRDRFKGD